MRTASSSVFRTLLLMVCLSPMAAFAPVSLAYWNTVPKRRLPRQHASRRLGPQRDDIRHANAVNSQSDMVEQRTSTSLFRTSPDAVSSFVVSKAKGGVGNFLNGCEFVYASWWTALSRIFFPTAKLGCAYALLSVYLYAFSPALYRHAVALAVRIAAAFATTGSYFFNNWTIPIKIGMLPFEYLFGMLGWKSVTVGMHPLSRFAFLGIYWAPILEEIMFRFGCDLFCDLKKYRSDRSRARGFTPELCFSILFGVTHFRNYIPPALLFVPDLAPVAMNLVRPLSFALVQGFITYKCSRLVFFPVYRKHGLMGSIGAHMTWNAAILAFCGL